MLASMKHVGERVGEYVGEHVGEHVRKHVGGHVSGHVCRYVRQPVRLHVRPAGMRVASSRAPRLCTVAMRGRRLKQLCRWTWRVVRSAVVVS